MKTKSTNRFLSVALALFMLLMSIPFSMLMTNARAAETPSTAKKGVYVLDASTDLTEGKIAEASSVQAGTADYFTLYYKSGSKIDKSEKKFSDDYVGSQRINFGGKAEPTKPSKVVGFKTNNSATVKVWWVEGSSDNRKLAIFDTAGTQVDAEEDTTAGTLYVSTLKVPKADTYYLGGVDNGNYIFKIEVTETPATKDYELVANDIAVGEYKDMTSKAGTEEYFTINYGGKGKVDASEQDFFGTFTGKNRINFGGGTAADYSAGRYIEFNAKDEGSVKIWWVSGDKQRTVQLYNADTKEVVKTEGADCAKGDKIISTIKFTAPGKYYIGAPAGTNYFFKVLVQEGKVVEVVRGDWTKVEAPVVETVAVNAEDKGKVDVTVTADVGVNGGDKLTVDMLDKDNNVIETKTSLAEKTSHTVTFAPEDSGEYTFKAKLVRDGSTPDKESAEKKFNFTLPLGVPTLSSATSKGNGTVEVIWNAVKEATGYEVYCGENKVGTTTTETKFMVTGLTVGTKYDFKVKAVRGTEVGEASSALSAKVTQEAQQTWSFCFYGTSTKAENNYFVGDLNADGKVQVVSKGGSGKFQEGSNDGLAFYYTAIPTNKNFTLKAKVHVDTWDLSSGQEGFGLMAMDSLPDAKGINTSDLFWSNMYRAGAQRFAYWYDSEAGVNYDKVGGKYQMNIGVGVQAKLGMTKDNIADVYKSATGKVEFVERALETLAVEKGLGNGTYCTIGNCTNPDTFKNPAVAELTDFIIEIQRNNTGYFLSYYTPDGKLVKTEKFYDPKALDQLDPDNVYVGFACARRMQATFSDVTLTTIDPKDDKPAEERPITKIDPKVTFGSSSIANSTEYELLIKSNVKGSTDIMVAGKKLTTVELPSDRTSTDKEYTVVKVTIAPGTTKIEVVFTPDKDQELPEYTALSSTDAVKSSISVKYNTYLEKQNNLYVSPKGTKGGNGGKEHPLDIYTAVSIVRPGQTIVLMEGTYKLSSTLTIERGIDGTADKMIKMVKDPEAKTRPVLDFQKKAGFTAVGDYWYFKDFDITNSADGIPGMYVSGSNCTLDRIDAYTNGDCGIYIRSKANSADPKSLWPKNNLILNCTAYNNADATGENADGFAAKFTVGEGNVFDGCVSYNNCDDGWDLYARGTSISSVTIKNCIAYENGHNTDGSIKGNGNGFKLGGENMPGGHKIINSIAFNNDLGGITCNSCPDIKIENCISFNNKKANVSLYTGNKSTVTDFAVNGLISFKTENTNEVDKLEPQTQKIESLQGENNYYWTGSACENNKGEKITAEAFKSLEFKGYERSEDGKVILKDGYLALSDKAPAALKSLMVALDGNYKLDEAYVVLDKVAIEADGELPPPTGFEIAIVISVIAIAGAAALVLIRRRRRSK